VLFGLGDFLVVFLEGGVATGGDVAIGGDLATGTGEDVATGGVVLRSRGRSPAVC